MIVLSTTLTKFELILAGAVTANELEWVISYEHISNQGTSTFNTKHGVSAGAGAVTLLAAPTLSGDKSKILSLAIHNADTASATLTIRYNDNGTIRRVAKVVLATLECLYYEDGAGWQALTTSGAIK